MAGMALWSSLLSPATSLLFVRTCIFDCFTVFTVSGMYCVQVEWQRPSVKVAAMYGGITEVFKSKVFHEATNSRVSIPYAYVRTYVQNAQPLGDPGKILLLSRSLCVFTSFSLSLSLSLSLSNNKHEEHQCMCACMRFCYACRITAHLSSHSP